MCAGCAGLLIGGLLALLLALGYFLGGLESLGDHFALVPGLAGVSFAIIVFALGPPYPFIRLAANASLAIGSFFILSAVDAARQDLHADLLVLCIIIYWIMGRTIYSRLSHRAICSECPEPLCELRRTASP